MGGGREGGERGREGRGVRREGGRGEREGGRGVMRGGEGRGELWGGTKEFSGSGLGQLFRGILYACLF